MTLRVGIRAVWVHLLLAGLSALMLGLAFAPVGWGWLAHFALVPVAIIALRSISTRRMVAVVYLVSFIWWLVMIRWMIPVTGGGFVGLAAYMAIYMPAAMALFRLLDRRLNAASVLTLPMAWVSLEMIRGYILAGGFGWYALGHSQAPFLPEHSVSRLIQIADIFGEHGVSFLLAMSSGLIIDLLARPLYKPTADGGRRMSRTLRAALVSWALAMVLALFYGQWRINQFDAATTPGPVIAVVQTNVAQDNKINPTVEQMRADWARLIELTRAAAATQPRPDLIVWPETVTPVPINVEAAAAYPVAAEYRAAVAELAAELGVSLLVGSGSDITEPTPMHYNSAHLFHATGEIDPARYDKIHRVPFGEFVPWVESFPRIKQWFIKTLTPYDHDYTVQQGQDWTVFEVELGEGTGGEGTEARRHEGTEGSDAGHGTRDAGHRTRDAGHGTPGPRDAGQFRVATPICFEDTVPRVIRRLVYGEEGRKRAQVIVNLTNDGWFAASRQPLQHFQIAVFRSVENRVPSARAVNTGMSGFIDSVGRVGPVVSVRATLQRIDGFAVTQVKLDARRTVFGRVGHLPGLILIAATGVLALVAMFRRDMMSGRRGTSQREA